MARSSRFARMISASLGALLLCSCATSPPRVRELQREADQYKGGRYHVDGYVKCLSFSHDGRYLAAGSGTGHLGVWDCEKRRVLHRFKFNAPIGFVGFTLNSNVIAGSYDGVIRSWGLSDGRENASINVAPELPMAYAAEIGIVATASHDQISIWEIAGGTRRCRFAPIGHVVTSLSFSPKGQLLLSGARGDDKGLRLWNMRTCAAHPFNFKSDRGGFASVAFSADGTLMAGGEIENARAFEIQTGREIAVYGGHSGDVSALAFSTDGEWLATTDSIDHSCYLWEARTGRRIVRLFGKNAMRAVVFSPARDFVVTGDNAGTIQIWNVW